MALSTGSVTVSTVATQIVAARDGRVSLTLSKVGGAVYLGDDTVTPETGFLWQGSNAPLSLPTVTALFGIVVGDGADATSAVISYAETY